MQKQSVPGAAPSRGRFLNTGNEPQLQPIDIGHDSYVALIEPDTAFWSLIRKDALAETLADSSFRAALRKKNASFAKEMQTSPIWAQAISGLFQLDRAMQSQLPVLLHSGEIA